MFYSAGGRPEKLEVHVLSYVFKVLYVLLPFLKKHGVAIAPPAPLVLPALQGPVLHMVTVSSSQQTKRNFIT